MIKKKLNKQKQKGVALAIGIILLLIIAVLGVTSMKTALMQEKMSASFTRTSKVDIVANSMLVSVEKYLYGLYESSNGESDIECLRPLCYRNTRVGTGYVNMDWYNFLANREMLYGNPYTALPQASGLSALSDYWGSPPRFFLYKIKDALSGGESLSEGGYNTKGPQMTYFKLASKADDPLNSYYVLYESTYAIAH